MPVEAKNRKANEFRAKADQLRAELLDESKPLTKDEIEAKSAEIRAFEARAAAAAEFTPEDEIERQGGDEALKRKNPNSEDADADTKDVAARMEQIAKEVRRHFGGPNGYLLAIAKRTLEPLTPHQQRVHAEIEALHKRTIVGTTGDSSGGEFLLPLQQVQEIFSVDNVQPGILQVARRYPVSGRSLRIPYVVQTDGTNTRPMAGIAAVSIVAENGDIPQQEPKFLQRVLNVQKWAAYSEIGDETLTDDMTGQLSPTLQKMVGGQVMNEMNGYMTIDGSGSGQPQGALLTSNTALIKVARKTATQINIEDVFNMYAQFLLTGNGATARWLINRTALPQLFALKLSGNTLVTWIMDLKGRPVMTLLGIQIEVCDLLAVLGSESDFALVNGDFYATAIREQLTVESSIHYKFKNDVTAFRFKARGGGICIPTDTFSYKAVGGVKQAPHSPFVTLDDVVAS